MQVPSIQEPMNRTFWKLYFNHNFNFREQWKREHQICTMRDRGSICVLYMYSTIFYRQKPSLKQIWMKYVPGTNIAS